MTTFSNFRPVPDPVLVAAIIESVEDARRAKIRPSPPPPTTAVRAISRRQREVRERKFARKMARVARWGLD